MKKNNYNESGAAVVELGVMLIVLVPLIFYFFFISDLCYQIVNTQETTISTVWDYSTAPIGVYKNKMWGKTTDYFYGGVDNFNRMEFADHTSAKLDYDKRSEEWKHTRPWAELDWGNGREAQVNTYNESDYYKTTTDAHQIACQRRDEYAYGSMNLTPIKNIFSGDGTGDSHSGRYLCWARGEVINYLIPKYFSPTGRVEEKKENELISARGNGFGVTKERNVYTDAKNKKGWLAFRNRASLLAGDWSSIVDHIGKSHKDHKDVTLSLAQDGLGSHALEDSYYYKKSKKVFNRFLLLGAAEAIGLYEGALISKKLALLVPPLPLPTSFFMAARFSHSSSDFNVKHYKFKTPLDTPMADELFTVSNEQYLSKGASKRGSYYLGAKQSLH